jgi:hypothetical protein
MRSPWFSTDDVRVELGVNHPTHFSYVDGSPVDGTYKQWLVVGFAPTATFRDGREIALKPVPAGCSIKGLEPLAIRAPARMVHKYRAV